MQMTTITIPFLNMSQGTIQKLEVFRATYTPRNILTVVFLLPIYRTCQNRCLGSQTPNPFHSTSELCSPTTFYQMILGI